MSNFKYYYRGPVIGCHAWWVKWKGIFRDGWCHDTENHPENGLIHGAERSKTKIQEDWEFRFQILLLNLGFGDPGSDFWFQLPSGGAVMGYQRQHEHYHRILLLRTEARTDGHIFSVQWCDHLYSDKIPFTDWNKKTDCAIRIPDLCHSYPGSTSIWLFKPFYELLACS